MILKIKLRLNPKSLFKFDFDVMKVLLKDKTWKDAERYLINSRQRKFNHLSPRKANQERSTNAVPEMQNVGVYCIPNVVDDSLSSRKESVTLERERRVIPESMPHTNEDLSDEENTESIAKFMSPARYKTSQRERRVIPESMPHTNEDVSDEENTESIVKFMSPARHKTSQCERRVIRESMPHTNEDVSDEENIESNVIVMSPARYKGDKTSQHERCVISVPHTNKDDSDEGNTESNVTFMSPVRHKTSHCERHFISGSITPTNEDISDEENSESNVIPMSPARYKTSHCEKRLVIPESMPQTNDDVSDEEKKEYNVMFMSPARHKTSYYERRDIPESMQCTNEDVSNEENTESNVTFMSPSRHTTSHRDGSVSPELVPASASEDGQDTAGSELPARHLSTLFSKRNQDLSPKQKPNVERQVAHEGYKNGSILPIRRKLYQHPGPSTREVDEITVHAPDIPESQSCNNRRIQREHPRPSTSKDTAVYVETTEPASSENLQHVKIQRNHPGSSTSKDTSIGVPESSEYTSTGNVHYTKNSPSTSKKRTLSPDVWSDEEFPVPQNKIRSRRREDYSFEDKRSIINFISKYKAYNKVKGREVWQRMADYKVCRDRTWQSLKEHYIKQIIPNLSVFRLPDEEVEKILAPFS